MEVLVHHIEEVQNMYKAFNKGDIPFILKTLDKDCIWESMGGNEIPYSGIYHGPDDVKMFFEKLGSSVDSQEMLAEHFFEAENLVVATGSWKAVVRQNKKPFSTIWSMQFEFNDNGKIVHFRDCFDTLNVSKAFAS
ncbi:MAG: hypothetical protein JWM28_1155 [Chitinophagaceae bacterium]|nr:hypothetical protein [Chitinophagaceae bacterium]